MDLSRSLFWKTVIRILGLLFLGATWFIGKGGWFLLLAGGLGIIAAECGWRFFRSISAGPYPWMLLAPLLLLNYASLTDFRIRMACFLMLVYVLVWARGREKNPLKITLGHWPGRYIWLLAFMVFALAAVVFQARGVLLSGDEPHYLMITQSLVEDGDVDLGNNMRDKTYRPYMPVDIAFHGTVRDGKYRTFHLPGVSFLLVPFFYLFRFSGAAIPASLFFRLCAAFCNAFFALGLFHVMKKTLPEKDNGAFFLFFLATFPLVFHAVHLYPELPAATLLIFAYLCGHRHSRRLLLAGLLLSGIPWFHLKYMVPAFVLAIFFMIGIWRENTPYKSRIRRLALFAAPQAVSAALLMIYSKVMYGSFNPTVISPDRNVFAIPLRARMETLLSFFLDQRDGLLVYAPVFLLLFLVFRKETRNQIRDFSLLAMIFFSYILFHAYTTVRGAYSPASRPTLHVIWIMVIFLIAVYRRAGESGKTLFRLLAGLTGFASVWLFYYPFFLYQPVTRDVSQRASSLLLFLGSKAVDLSSFFPSFLKISNAGYRPNWIWLGTLAAGAILFYVRPPWRALARTTRFIFPALGLLVLFFICFVPHVQLRTRYTAAKLAFYNNSHNFTFHPESGSFKILAGQDYDLFFDMAGCAAERLDLRLLNPHGIALSVRNGRRTLLAENRAAENRIDVSLRGLNEFSLGKRNLVHLGLESKAVRGTTFFWLEFH